MNNPIRDIGLRDAQGVPVEVSADCDGVRIRVGLDAAVLEAPQREQFQRLSMEAERRAEAWAAEHEDGALHDPWARDLTDWLHDDGTPCLVYIAPDNGTRWWCTDHQQYLKRPDGA